MIKTWTVLLPTPEATTTPVLPEITEHTPDKTSRDSLGVPCLLSEVFVQAFGLDVARKLLGGSLYHNCQTGVNQFRKAGHWSREPEPGAVVFFTNDQRAYHTGIVTEVTASRIKTVEGNTSGASGVIENGGGVCQKSYAKNYSKILGYGLPDWSLVRKSGWHQEDGGWRFYLGNTGEPVRNNWYKDGEDWYWFDGAGMMVYDTWKTGKDGRWYYLGTDGKMFKGYLGATRPGAVSA